MAKAVNVADSAGLEKFNHFYLTQVESLLSQDKGGDDELIEKLFTAVCFTLQCINLSKATDKLVVFNKDNRKIEIWSEIF